MFIWYLLKILHLNILYLFVVTLIIIIIIIGCFGRCDLCSPSALLLNELVDLLSDLLQSVQLTLPEHLTQLLRHLSQTHSHTDTASQL